MMEFFESLLPRFSSSLLPMPVALGMAALITAITFWTYYGSRRWTQAIVYSGVAAFVFGIVWHFIAQPALEGGLSSVPLSRFLASLLAVPGLAVIWLIERNRHYEGVTAAQGIRTWILLAVRLGALVCALFVVLSPTWAYKEIDPTPSRIVILIDSSRSMETQDEAPRNSSRWEAVKRDLEEAKNAITELREKYNVTVILRAFDSRVQAYTETTLPAGEATAVYRALQDGYAEGKDGLRPGEKLQGIILMSDGRDNVGQPLRDNVVSPLRRGGVPVHAIGYGQPGGSELQADIVMAAIDAPSTARVKDRLSVRGVLQAQRFQNRKIDVWLYLDDKPALENAHGGMEGKPVKITLEPKSVSETIPFEMPAFRLPDAAGDYRLMLKAVPPPGEKELTDQNNIVSTYISLTKDGLSVMYFDKRRLESRFLSEALKNDERISVFRAYLAEDAGADAEKWRQQVRETLQKSDIDVFIIGDIPASRFGDSAAPDSILNIIHKKVQEGGKGLLMIGGHESFANGGWDRTPLGRGAGGRQATFAELLPVEMDEQGMLEPQGGQREVKFMPRDQIIQEETALGQFALRLDSDPKQNKEWWESLPPLSGGNRLGRRRGDATVLAELPDQGGSHILLAVQRSGKGRGAALAVDTTWQWFRGGTPRRKEDEAKDLHLSAAREAHLRFWRQLILWLAQQDSTGSAIRIELSQRRLAFGKEQTITMQAREVTPGGAKDLQKPLKGAAFEVKVMRVDPATGKPDPKTEMNVDGINPLGGEDAKSQAVFSKVPDSGEYLVQVKARHQGKDLGVATARFMVYRDDTELLNRSANHADLETIATRTAGSFQLHGGLATILEKLREEHVTKVTRLVKYPDWDDPSYPLQGTVFLLFVLCLSTEWVLRRAWGLV